MAKKFSVGVLAVIISILVIGSLSAAGGREKAAATADGPLRMKIMTQLNNQLPDLRNEYWRYVQEVTNTILDIDFVPVNEYQTKMDLVLSSGDLPDVMSVILEAPTYVVAATNGAFWDLTDVLGDFSNYPYLRESASHGAYETTRINGRNYVIPKMRTKVHPVQSIRLDLLEKHGIGIPTTIEEFHQALKTVVAAEPDVFGMLLSGRTYDQTFAMGFGLNNPSYNEEGGLIHPQLTDDFIDMMAWYRELYSDGLLPREFAVMNLDQKKEIYESGRAVSWYRGVNQVYDIEQIIKRVNPGAEVIPLPPMSGPGGYTVDIRDGYLGGFAIDARVNEPKMLRIMEYMDFTSSPEIWELGMFGLEGIHYNEVDGLKVLTDKGNREMQTSSFQIFAFRFDPYMRIRNPAAPPEYWDKMYSYVQDYEVVGQVPIETWLLSSTWSAEWGKYVAEFESLCVQVIMGNATIGQLRNYVESLRNRPEMKRAFAELAESYSQRLGQ